MVSTHRLECIYPYSTSLISNIPISQAMAACNVKKNKKQEDTFNQKLRLQWAF